MYSLWIVLPFFMAAVMPRGHGGDGFGDDPPDPFRGGSHHQQDPEPVYQRKGRGPAKNDKLRRLWEANKKRPLAMPLDEDCTWGPTGDVGGLFTREAGSYMLRNMPLGYTSFTDMPGHVIDAFWRHMGGFFDLAAFGNELESEESATIWAGLRHHVNNVFRYKKGQYTLKYDQMAAQNMPIEDIKRRPPQGMSERNWGHLVDYCQSEAFQKRSKANKENRKKLTVQNRGGSRSYARTAFKENLNRVEAYKVHHTDRDGNFGSEEEEANFNRLVAELAASSFTPDGQCILSPQEYVQIFENTLGARRGHIKGIGPKPPGSSSRRYHGSSSTGKGTQSTPTNIFTPEQMRGMLMDPTFHTYMQELYQMRPPTIPTSWTQPNPSGSGSIRLSEGSGSRGAGGSGTGQDDQSSSSSDDDNNDYDNDDDNDDGGNDDGGNDGNNNNDVYRPTYNDDNWYFS